MSMSMTRATTQTSTFFLNLTIMRRASRVLSHQLMHRRTQDRIREEKPLANRRKKRITKKCVRLGSTSFSFRYFGENQMESIDHLRMRKYGS